MITEQGTVSEAKPPIDPRNLSLTHNTPDKNGIVRYNILTEAGLCIEDWICPLWEVEDRFDMVCENLYKVC